MLRVRVVAISLCLLARAVVASGDATLNLYLQPLPPESARLSFELASIEAVASNGNVVPLKLALASIDQAACGRQRLLASARLPSGSYQGFQLVVRRANLGGQGAASLAVPAAPVRITFAFSVAGERGSVIWLSLRHGDSIRDGYEFTPAFTAVSPPLPIPARAGFVSNAASNTVTVFDKQLMQVVGLIDTCAGSAGMALDQQRRRLYLACSRSDEIRAIDLASGEVLERVHLSPGDRPQDLALTPDGSVLLSANVGSNSVGFLDARSLAFRERVNVGGSPAWIATDPSGRRGFVLNAQSDSVSVIDLGTRQVVSTVATASAPVQGRFNRLGDRFYVAHERSPYMTVLDAVSLSVLGKPRLRESAPAIEVDTVRGLVCLGGGSNPTVEFYDPNALMPLFAMRSRAGVGYMRIDAEDSTLYLVNVDTRTVVVAQLASRKVVAEIDVGDRPFRVVVMGEK